jgi:hypothetical protein
MAMTLRGASIIRVRQIGLSPSGHLLRPGGMRRAGPEALMTKVIAYFADRPTARRRLL